MKNIHTQISDCLEEYNKLLGTDESTVRDIQPPAQILKDINIVTKVFRSTNVSFAVALTNSSHVLYYISPISVALHAAFANETNILEIFGRRNKTYGTEITKGSIAFLLLLITKFVGKID